MDVGFGTRYIGRYYFDAANTSKSEAAVLFDMALAYRISKAASVSVHVQNLTDKQYVVGSGTANYYNPEPFIERCFTLFLVIGENIILGNRKTE
ncbi:TonB-dependent receptor [Vibrio sp. PP-XX7]